MIVYKTVNLINGKIYVGQDSKNDPNYLGSGVLLERAIRKYGKENFQKIVLEVCLNKNELDEKEIYWIQKLDSMNQQIGYNLTKGGGGTLGFHFTHSEETKLKMKKKKKIVSEETRKKMSESHKKFRTEEEIKAKIDENNRLRREKYKQIHANDIKKDMSICQKGIRRSIETRNRISEANRRRKGKGVRDPITKKLSYPTAV